MTLEEAKEKIQLGKKYQHYEGRIYAVDCITIDVETSRPMVLYHEVETEEAIKYFVRSADTWLEPETIIVPRFKLLKEE